MCHEAVCLRQTEELSIYRLSLFSAPHHRRQLLRSGYERPTRRLGDGTRDSSILGVQGQDDVGYRLRVQEPLPCFCRHQRWSSKKGNGNGFFVFLSDALITSS